MKLIKTEDGSYTAFNEKLQEHYHSTTGALEEAFEKHVKPLGISDGMVILDFCFGLGYNSFAALFEHKNIRITALEKDIEILKLIKNIKISDPFKQIFNHYQNIFQLKTISDSSGNEIDLIIDDALISMKSLTENYYDRVFFDPFSPQKTPEMWTVEVFTEIFRCLKHGGKLSTYSCSKRIRNNLKEAGFLVIDGPCIGRRSPSTIAIKNQQVEMR